MLLFRVAARPVVLRALATFGAIAAPVAIVFGPQGLDANVLVRAMNASLGLRMAIWLGWLLLAAPAAHAVFLAKGTLMLRALSSSSSSSRRQLLPQVMMLAAFVHLPWAILFARGEGLLAAIGAATTAIAIESSIVARRYWLIALSVIAAFAKATIAGWVLAPIAVHLAWVRAPEREDRAWMWIRSSSSTSAFVNLVLAHLLRLGRMERARIVFATMLMALGGAGLLTLRSDPTPRPVTRALLIMALPILLTASMFVAPLRESERQMHALLRSLRVRRAFVLAAFLVALATPTTALAAATSSISLSFAKIEGPPMLLGSIAFSIALSSVGWSLVVGLWSRRR